MKKCILILFITGYGLSVTAQKGILGSINKAAGNDSSKSVISAVAKSIGGNSGSLSNEEIIKGLKEALSVGTENSTKKLGSADGFFADAAIKILMPEEAKKAESTLRSFGLSSVVDKAILSMNRAAEDAAGAVTSIFIDAIKSMTLSDGIGILKGGDFAATEYLKKSTTTVLIEKMRPVIQVSLDKVNATQYWNDVFTAYNKFSSKKIETDLSAYVTERAMEGIFYQVGLEEQKIRKDPAAQVTDLLKKVFAK